MNLDKPLVREAGGGHDALPPQVGRPRGSAARELADSLGVSEACALGYITLLTSAGRLRIEAGCPARLPATAPPARRSRTPPDLAPPGHSCPTSPAESRP